MFRRRSGLLLKVLRTFNLRPASRDQYKRENVIGIYTIERYDFGVKYFEAYRQFKLGQSTTL